MRSARATSLDRDSPARGDERRGPRRGKLLAPALLAALIVVGTVGGPDGLDVDARVAGLAGAAAVLAWRRSAMLAAITVAAVVTALLRALG